MTQEHSDLGFVNREVNNAHIQFSNVPGPDHKGVAFLGGFVPEDPMMPTALRQTRDNRPVDAFVQGADYKFHMDGSYLYGGLIYSHFGHVMSEMVHRVVTTRRHFRERPWIFVGLSKGTPLLGYHHLPGAFKAALNFLNVAKENVLCLHANAHVEHLNIAEQGSDFGGGPKPGYLSLLKTHAEARLAALYEEGSTHRLVYVSKSNLPHGGSFLGQRYLETQLAKEGFLVFHPEEHELSWQMEVYHRADIVIFPEGSACHGTELLGEKMLGTCVFLERRSNHRRVFHNVLRPRSERFVPLSGFMDLADAIRDLAIEAPARHISVSVYDADRLVDTFRQQKIARLSHFTKAAYLDVCKSDLDEYVARLHKHGMQDLGDGALAAMSAALDTLR